MRKIGVVLPWDSPFIWRHSMENMLNWNKPPDTETNFFFGKGWCAAARHNHGVEKALEWGADLIVFAGSDHIVERDYIVKLYGNVFDDGWDMATGIISSRGAFVREGGVFTYWAFKGMDIPYPPSEHGGEHGVMPGKLPGFAYDHITTIPRFWQRVGKDAPSQEIQCVGTGTLAVKKEVFSALERPWFAEQLLKDNANFGRHATNDTAFVARAVFDHGFRLWLNTDIDARHLEIFPIDPTYEERFEDKKGESNWSPIGSVMAQGNF